MNEVARLRQEEKVAVATNRARQVLRFRAFAPRAIEWRVLITDHDIQRARELAGADFVRCVPVRPPPPRAHEDDRWPEKWEQSKASLRMALTHWRAQVGEMEAADRPEGPVGMQHEVGRADIGVQKPDLVNSKYTDSCLLLQSIVDFVLKSSCPRFHAKGAGRANWFSDVVFSSF